MLYSKNGIDLGDVVVFVDWVDGIALLAAHVSQLRGEGVRLVSGDILAWEKRVDPPPLVVGCDDVRVGADLPMGAWWAQKSQTRSPSRPSAPSEPMGPDAANERAIEHLVVYLNGRLEYGMRSFSVHADISDQIARRFRQRGWTVTKERMLERDRVMIYLNSPPGAGPATSDEADYAEAARGAIALESDGRGNAS